MLKAIVFDLDGTLANSSTCIIETMHEVARQMNLPPVSDDAVRDMIGQHLNVMFPTLYNIHGVDMEEAIRLYSIEYVRLTATLERLFEGALELIQTLSQTDVLLAIATGKSQSGAENACERLELTPYLDSIHGIIPGTPGKPDPAVLIRAMKALGVSAAECIMVGDTTFDMQLSQAVGVEAIGVDWGVHSRDKLEACGVNVMASMQELLGTLV